jgi:hypothetical protein
MRNKYLYILRKHHRIFEHEGWSTTLKLNNKIVDEFYHGEWIFVGRVTWSPSFRPLKISIQTFQKKSKTISGYR